MLQAVSNVDSTYTENGKNSFEDEIKTLFLKIKELNIPILAWGGDYLHVFFLSYIEKMQTPSDFTFFLTELRNAIWTEKGETLPERELLYHSVLCEFLTVKRDILVSSKRWNTSTITFLFYFFREVPNLPVSFLNIVSQLICEKKDWKPIQIATILRTMESYRETTIWKTIIQNAYDILLQFHLDDYEFNEIQSLIIALEHLDIEIPIELLNHWNTRQNEEAHEYYTQTGHENEIFDRIKHDYSFEWYSLEQNVYICGYEVDVVMYDIQGKIYAIIESDGWSHSDDKIQKKDQRRDALFLRRGISDLIIRCGIHGNKILSNEHILSWDTTPKNSQDMIPLDPRKLEWLQMKFAR